MKRYEKYTRRRYLMPAADVTALRETLGLSKSQLAAALGVSRRTIIRGEQRGMEIQAKVQEAWYRLQKQAQAVTLSARSRTKCHTRPQRGSDSGERP